eukprot:2721191-Ditylum_brightwellii.AAC.1
MTAAIAQLDLPPKTITTDKLIYFTLCHPTNHIQNSLLKVESTTIYNNLLKNSANYTMLEHPLNFFNMEQTGCPTSLDSRDWSCYSSGG